MSIRIVAMLLLSVVALPARATDDPRTVVARAIKALGGEAALSKASAFTYRMKIALFIQGKEGKATARVTMDNFRRYRQDFRSEVGGNKVTGVLMLSGHKGSRSINFKSTNLNREGVDNLRHIAELTMTSINVMPIRDYRLQSIDEEDVGGRPAVGLKVHPPDHKEFNIYFDKASGLPVKLTGRVVGFNNNESTQEWTFSDYRVIGGIRKAMKIEIKRDGEPFQKIEVIDLPASLSVTGDLMNWPRS